MADITVSMSPARGSFGRIIDRLRDGLARRRRYARVINELDRLDARGLADLGISRSDFRAIASGTYVQGR